MAFDGVFTHFIIKELKKNIEKGKINKVYQISSWELLFNIRANRTNQKLLISIHPNYARAHLTNMVYTYPKEPPMFCMLLRKHLEGGIITNISQKDNDRIIIITIEHVNEIGDKTNKLLIIELMGKHSNIILINKDDNKIIDSIKRVSPFQNTVRTLQPGASYEYPPCKDKLNPFLATKDNIQSNLKLPSDNLSKQLVNMFEGLSPELAKEIIFRAEFNQNPLILSNVFNDIFNNQINPTIVSDDNKEYFHIIPLYSINKNCRYYNNLSDMLDRFFFGKDQRDRIKQQSNDLGKFIKNELDKNKKKIYKLENDLHNAENADYYKLCGELITANIYKVEKGMNNVTVQNYYSKNNEEINISLDPLLTPTQNFQKYFQKYQKAKKSIDHIYKQMELTQEEIKYFDTLHEQMKTANIHDALEIREELELSGYLKKQQTKKRKNVKPKYSTYLSPDGVEILVGKNNMQNDYLTHKLAKRNETWMHAKDIPGSHIVIKNEDNLSEDTIRTAAQLAAYFSKARQSSSVPVDYTKVKHVKKIPGGKLGFVSYDNQKTIYIDPDEEFILNLKIKKQ